MLKLRRSVLIIAHPGHELRVFGWFEQARPLLCALTVGSRSTNGGRLSFTEDLAAEAGATVGPLFGRYRDREVYDALLACDPGPFLEWTAELTDVLVEQDPDYVVVDGWQMYNVSHDLVHVMSRAATRRAADRLGHMIEVLEFNVVPRALSAELPLGQEVLRIDLDDAAFRRKRAAAARYGDVQQEIDQIMALEGPDAQRTEILRSVVEFETLLRSAPRVPPFEKYGEQRVAASVYEDVIRWSAHVRPIVETLLELQPA